MQVFTRPPSQRGFVYPYLPCIVDWPLTWACLSIKLPQMLGGSSSGLRCYGLAQWRSSLPNFRGVFLLLQTLRDPPIQGFYNFICRRAALRLIFDMPDSNHQCKTRFFFVQRVNQVCHPDKWDHIGSFYDYSWGLLNKSSKSSGLSRPSICTLYFFNILFLFCFSHSLPNDPS